MRVWLVESITFMPTTGRFGMHPLPVTIFPGWVETDYLASEKDQAFVDRLIRGGLLLTQTQLDELEKRR